MRPSLREIAAAADPRKEILESVGKLDDYDVFHNLVLVATHIAAEKTQGGVYLPDRSLAEDRFQGKVGLVLKVGPLAFVDDKVVQFGGKTVERGQWVVYRPSDGIEHFVRSLKTRGAGIACRLIEDSYIKGRVDDPAMIY